MKTAELVRKIDEALSQNFDVMLDVEFFSFLDCPVERLFDVTTTLCPRTLVSLEPRANTDPETKLQMTFGGPHFNMPWDFSTDTPVTGTFLGAIMYPTVSQRNNRWYIFFQGDILSITRVGSTTTYIIPQGP